MKESLFKIQVAKHLRQQRKARGLSLDKTAALTGVSKAMLGQIERGESSPTIATLWKIASGINTSFSAFFAHDDQLCRHDMAFPDDPNMEVETLFPYQEDAGFEMFEITLTDFHQQHSSPHAHGVIEHILVLEGELVVQCGDVLHTLKMGERMRFFADQEHGYFARSDRVVFQNIVCYP